MCEIFKEYIYFFNIYVCETVIIVGDIALNTDTVIAILN